MKANELAFLAVRVLALVVLIMGVRQLFQLLEAAAPVYLYFAGFPYGQLWLIAAVPALLLIALGAALWMSAGRLSRHLVPGGAADPAGAGGAHPAAPSPRLKDAEGFVLSVVGLVVLVLAAARLARSVVYAVTVGGEGIRFDLDGYLYVMAEQLVLMAIGAVLLVRAEGLATRLRKIRGAASRTGGNADA